MQELMNPLNQDKSMRIKELMSFWHSKIPNFIYDCCYEDLVKNPVEETKKLISFCNLEWEDNCLDHTKIR